MSHSITAACNGCQACKKICPVEAISGEKKEQHTVDASLCIECGACGRICPQQAVLDQSGKPCTMIKRSAWKKPKVQVEACISCNICIDACPVNCLALSESKTAKDLHGHPYLSDEKACIGCGFCSQECPVDAISLS